MTLQPSTLARQEVAQADTLAALRRCVAGLERRGNTRPEVAHLPFGDPAVDSVLPGGGLQLGALHEVAGAGPDIEHGAGRRPDDAVRLQRLADLARTARVPTPATGDVLFHTPERRILQDVVTCIRKGCTIDAAGFRRERFC